MASSVEWTTKIKDVAEVIAIFVGGAWAYFNHFRGRTYKPRIELSLEAEFLKDGSRSFLKIASHAENVGLTWVAINRERSASMLYNRPVHPRHSWSEGNGRSGLRNRYSSVID
jgi:hypothetical protein